MKRRILALTLCFGLVLMFGSSVALAQYKLTNLVSNQVGMAKHIDPLLVNAWGLVYPPGGPFWISDEGTGWSTLYTGIGVKKSLEVEIPSLTDAGTGSPTGIVFNGSQEFQVEGWASIFLFATLDGTISGWAPQSDFNNSIIAVKSKGSVYTGLAITNKPAGNRLFAADTANNKVDVYDGSFSLVTSFTDTTLPAGFTPFGIQDINGQVYVSFADSTGGAGGFVDIFTEDGILLKQLISGRPLNQPWGFAMAPKNFGPLSNTLLVSNNTNRGTINAFNALTGQFVGSVRDTNGKLIFIDQLWGIDFGGGSANNGRKNQLFFTAGPSNNLAGTFGVISLK
ncbi:MAG TPA: TIGR03118 family protein [Terriglobales bacterium]|nr:TIGR03118 family protein [Terriglobales bacterium]